MFLTLFTYLMKFVDISKATMHSNNQQQQKRRCTHSSAYACQLNGCWQHVANAQCPIGAGIMGGNKAALHSNSSSTSSGCDSNTSSKENFPMDDERPAVRHQSLTPQQLQQMRHMQQLQQRQLQLLQEQLLQRRKLQQQLREQGVTMQGSSGSNTSATLTCNQQYLLQQRLQQEQQRYGNHNYLNNNNNNYDYYVNDMLNNNNNNNNINVKNHNFSNIERAIIKGQKSRRGMTEFSTSNDTNKTHLSQPPLQNSPRHAIIHNSHFSPQHTSSPQNPANITNCKQQQPQQFAYTNLNGRNSQHTLPLNNSTAKIHNNHNRHQNNGPHSPTSTAARSPLHHYRNPLNSPSYSPFAYAYQQQAATTAQQQQHQHLLREKLPALLTQTQYQQHLNDLLQQQQHLQQHQQRLLSAKNADDELSEESLKQNVAIVLNNLDRYNNALRSIILNEQVSTHTGSSVFYNDDDDEDSLSLASGCNFTEANSNYNHNNNNNNNSKMATAATPESDYNSNATTPGSRSIMLPYDSNMQQPQQNNLVGYATAAAAGGGGACVNVPGNVGGGGGFNLNCSLASSHDFTHDNSDYQWFIDYGYRDGSAGMQRSVLSSLSTSYNAMSDLIYYEDLAKNLDANLAEVDMESFRAEDIHSLLSQLPSYCKSLGAGGNTHRLQQSLLQQHQQHMLPSAMQHGSQQHNNMLSQTSTSSTNELIDNSICKSELLFSPVKESHISVDSLDMDAYPEDGDIILTCKANKDNYTIAFEGSVLYSDESFYEPHEIAMKNKQNCINLHSNLDDIVQRKALEVSMSRSEQAFNMPSNKLQKSTTTQLQRYPSGNNNTTELAPPICHAPHCIVRKSNSLPNLCDSQMELQQSTTCYTEQQHQLQPQQQPELQQQPQQPQQQQLLQQQQQQQQQQLNVSQVNRQGATLDACKSRNLLPMCQMPISCSSNSGSMLEQQQAQRHRHRCYCTTSHTSTGGGAQNYSPNASSPAQQKPATQITGSTSSGNSNPPAFNLVKLFIKQKSSNCSLDDQQLASAHTTCMDISSGCWPSSDAAGSGSGASSSSSLEQRMRKKSMHDSGKGSALSRHDEEDLLEELHGDCCRAARGGSPAQRRRSMPLRHPQLCQLATQHHSQGMSGISLQSSDASRSNSEQLTQVDAVAEAQRLGRRNPSSGSEMITRSMQTSCGSLSSRSSLSERYRCVPPSFLAKLNNLGEERQAPIYVIYPNYALPDLGFVKTSTTADVIFSPFNYKTALGSSSSTDTLKRRYSPSANDTALLQNMDYTHVADWQSLATLLPNEYRQRLKHIPEVNGMWRELEHEQSQRPLFCMTPPIRRNRAHICDCAKFLQPVQTAPEEANSSSGSSSQQPSSGYRGSSTLLTSDSELDGGDPLKPMYVYQYEQQRLEAGAELNAGKMPPQPMPRGILRKSASATTRNKRNSMIEDQQKKMSNLEKRRSLQEPAYQHVIGSSEELGDVFEEEPEPPRTERLSRKDVDARVRAEHFLASLPRSELKYYAEIAAILEFESAEPEVHYDVAALKKEVSRALSQQKKVSFNDLDGQVAANNAQFLNAGTRQQLFATPPNSPNHSLAAGLRMPNAANMTQRRCAQVDLHGKKPSTVDEIERRKIESNRFKRLQIQWELMSKDSSMLKELACMPETKSGGSTPTSAAAAAAAVANAHKSRIPRPVSYPAGKRVDNSKTIMNKTFTKSAPTATKTACVSPRIARLTDDAKGKSLRSPSRIVPPKRYSMAAIGSPAVTSPTSAVNSPNGGGSTPGSASRARTPNSRVAVTAPNTPRRRVQSPRATIPRVR